MKETTADFFTAVFIIAVLYVLVRPKSAAAETIKLFGDAIAGLVRTATDL